MDTETPVSRLMHAGILHCSPQTPLNEAANRMAAGGDRILQELAGRMSETLGEADELGRLAGDEFIAIIAPGGDHDGVVRHARRLMSAVNAPLEQAGQHFRIGCSVGIAIYPDDGEEASALIQHASTALRRAKHEGRNTLRLYRAEMHEAIHQRLAILAPDQNPTGVLQGLREIPCEVAIDDFGTGYSSLSYLHELPANTLKIDRAFIGGLAENRNSRAIVAAITSLARELGMKVVAEGVETPEQLSAVESFPVDLVQGFLLGRPTPAEGVEQALRTETA